MQSDQSLCWSLKHWLTVKLLTENQSGFLSLKGGSTGSSESTLVIMPHCWISHVAAHLMADVQMMILDFAGRNAIWLILQSHGSFLTPSSLFMLLTKLGSSSLFIL